MTELNFDVSSWVRTEYGTEEERATSGWLRVRLGDQPATRVDDEWSKSVRDEIFVSAYPVALWIAASWWRLLYEALPYADPPTNCRMAHELGAVGHGFVWPRIRFISDGEWVEVHSWPSGSERRGPIRYLTQAHV